MRFFLDMCIIIYYTSKDGSFFSTKAEEFMKKNEKNELLICYYIIDWDLPKWIKRQKIIVDEAIKKIINPSHEYQKSEGWSSLYDREKQKLEKILAKAKFSKDKNDFITRMLTFQKDIEINITNFIKIKAKKVVQISDIDKKLFSSLFSIIRNKSDANIIASGIQEHNNQTLVLVTNDKKDWNKENIELSMDQDSTLLKKYPKIPELVYLIDL